MNVSSFSMDVSNLLYGCNVSKSECHFYNVFVLCSALMSLLLYGSFFVIYSHLCYTVLVFCVLRHTLYYNFWYWKALLKMTLALFGIDWNRLFRSRKLILDLSLITKELSYNFLSDKNVLRHWFCHGYNKKMQAVITKHFVNTGLWWMWHFMYQDLKTSYSSDLNDVLKQLVSLWCVCVLDPSHIIETGIQWLYAPNLNQENCQHCIAA